MKLFKNLTGPVLFVDRAEKLFANFNTDNEEGPKCYGQEMILATPGKVWSITAELSYIEIPKGLLWADGSGRGYALGAGYAFSGKPEAAVLVAIEAAINFDKSCGGEAIVECLAPKYRAVQPAPKRGNVSRAAVRKAVKEAV